MATYRLGDLGWLQFEQLCTELLVDAGVERSSWSGSADELRTTFVDRLHAPHLGLTLREPALILVAWIRHGADRRRVQQAVRDEADRSRVVLLTNEDATLLEIDDRAVALGATELSRILDDAPSVRRRTPFVLGIRELGSLVDPSVLASSTADIDAATALAPVFVPTAAYRRTLEVLDRHRFAVVTGPPEMGKTAIARMIGLVGLSEGYELHEIHDPDSFWRLLARKERQIFVADDAFGSTEYRPDASERWAIELDRVLRALDDNHRLIWTSRPAPLRAGLRRIHREHGVERWPQPAEVYVDAGELEVEEKALILLRHAQAARISYVAVALVRAHATTIVEHEHFTPERIRRFVAERLPDLSKSGDVAGLSVRDSVAAEIKEPTRAMATSLAALPPELRALLVGLVDSAPRAVSERELTAAVRRHADGGLPRAPAELIDRLTDHFVRIVPPDSVTWVHPSWRDLVIDDIAADNALRQRFLRSCGLEGLLLALSTAGGTAGERQLPLLRADSDWDLAAARSRELVPHLDDHEIFRLLTTLREAVANAHGADAHELDAIAGELLDKTSRGLAASKLPIPLAVITAWFGLASEVGDAPAPPDMTATWVEAVPTAAIDVGDPDDLRRFVDWIALVELLRTNDEVRIREFGFPTRQEEAVGAAVQSIHGLALKRETENREELGVVLEWIWRHYPGLQAAVVDAGDALNMRTGDDRDWFEPTFETPKAARRPRRTSIVNRILRDLRSAPQGGAQSESRSQL